MLIVPICVLMTGIIFILIGLLVFGLFISIVAIVGGIGNILRR